MDILVRRQTSMFTVGSSNFSKFIFPEFISLIDLFIVKKPSDFFSLISRRKASDASVNCVNLISHISIIFIVKVFCYNPLSGGSAEWKANCLPHLSL